MHTVDTADTQTHSANIPDEFRVAHTNAQQKFTSFLSQVEQGQHNRETFLVQGKSGDTQSMRINAQSLSDGFIELTAALYRESGFAEADQLSRRLLFDFAYSIGQKDARELHAFLGLEDPVEKITVGPIYFAYTGWSSIRILKESVLTGNEDFKLFYELTDVPQFNASDNNISPAAGATCIMNAGYFCGWCAESVGLQLANENLEYRKGEFRQCRYVIAPPHRMASAIESYHQTLGTGESNQSNAQIAEYLQRTKYQEELTNERGFISRILDTANSLICVFDNTGNILKFNAECERVTGFRSSDIIGGKIWEKLILPEERQDVQQVFESLGKSVSTSTYENYWLTCDGEKRLIEWANGIISDDSGNVEYIIATGRDITEKRAMEQQLADAQNLESLGRLAAGIAHEINTPTQYIGDNVQFAMDSLDDIFQFMNAARTQLDEQMLFYPENAQLRSLDTMWKETDIDYLLEELPTALKQSKMGLTRISEIVSAMKKFAHTGQNEFSSGDINQIVTDAITISRNEWKYVAEVTTALGENMPFILCYPSELGQVILNIVVNAAHAIGDAQQADSSHRGKIHVETIPHPDRIEIVIEDNGPGIPDSVREKIFDPFFTTKEVGRGTGQGLAISRSIVEEKHFGKIHVHTTEGIGTTFRIVLPILTPQMLTSASAQRNKSISG